MRLKPEPFTNWNDIVRNILVLREDMTEKEKQDEAILHQVLSRLHGINYHYRNLPPDYRYFLRDQELSATIASSFGKAHSVNYIPTCLNKFVSGVKRMNSLPKDLLWPMRYSSPLSSFHGAPRQRREMISKLFKRHLPHGWQTISNVENADGTMTITIREGAGKS